MNRRKLEAIREEVGALRRSQPKAREFESLAVQLGRKKVNRGKEPTFESEAFPHLRPLSIPNHKGRDIPRGTKNSILNQLEDDLDAWDEALASQERGNGRENGSDAE
jgi:hypothetical protein